MDLTLNHVVIHEIKKQQHHDIEAIDKKNVVLPNDNELVIKLVQGVVGIYGRRNNSAHYGVFLPPNKAGQFPPKFAAYAAASSITSQQFIDVSHVAVDELERLAKGISAASGGYILVADYSNDQGRFFLIAMLKKKAGINLNANLVPEGIQQLDLNSLHQAAKINFSRFDEFLRATAEEQKEINYLSFVSPSINTTTAGYFISAIGCSKGTASAKAIAAVIKESSAFFFSKPELKQHRTEFKDRLTSYLAECAEKGKSATLSQIDKIARKFFPAEDLLIADALSDELLTLLNSEKHGVPSEFPVSKTAVKKYTHIRHQTASWDLNISVTALGDNSDAEIEYQPKNGGKLIIRHLPAEMREKIEEALRDRKVEAAKDDCETN